MSGSLDSERRLERAAVIVCLAATVAFGLGPGGSASRAASVAAGGLLVALSYVTTRSGVGVLVSLLTSGARPQSVRSARRIALRIAGRYALLALLAYVMIARLRLHPVGLIVGVSSVVAAVSIEAIRLQLQKKPKA